MKVKNYVLFQNIWRMALILLVLMLITPQPLVAQKQTNTMPQDDKPLTINTDLVTFNVSVTDREGRAVSGLSKNVFNVFDNKTLQEIHFFSDEDTPASISIVFDTSGSMSEKKISQAKEALASFIQTSHAGDEFFLIDFNSRARLLLDRTRDGDAVLSKFTFVEPQGNTAVYDAVYLGVEKVMQGSHPKKVVLLISDGEDNNSRYSYRELRRRLRESEVIIYAIGFGGFYPLKGGLNGRETLRELASTSGGKAFFPKGQVDMSEAFEQIALEIRHLYSISYYPTDFAVNGKWHRLRVKVNFPIGSPRFSVRSREGYFAGINH
jgi:Ca-activated chloride channel family protein